MKLKIPPPVQMLFWALVMWLIHRTTGIVWGVNGFRYSLAMVGVTAGIVIAITAIVQFRRANTTIHPNHPQYTSALVTAGIFSYSRNPMYTGLLLILTAWGMWLGNPFNLIPLAGFVVCLQHLQIRPEEAALGSLFAEKYFDYCARVRRWI